MNLWQGVGGRMAAEAGEEWPADGFERRPRKEQITIRLDPGMVADARVIAARKGIGHHTLLRMWVMEGIVRAYEDGVINSPPRSWANGAAVDSAAANEAAVSAGRR